MRPDGQTIALAREQRKEMTETERRAWKILRNRSVLRVKFRRQHPLGRYILDFYCPEGHLAVELDGSIHSQPSQLRRDKKKDAFLAGQGIHVLRVPNGLVLQDPEGFVKKVLANLPSPTASRSPLSLKGRGK